MIKFTRRIVVLIFLVLYGQYAHTQESKPVSIELNDVSLEEAIDILEKETGILFYYKRIWLKDKKVNYSAIEQPLTKILDSILTSTTINYYRYSDKQIVLTENNLIYDNLPNTFFGAKKRDTIIQEHLERGLSPVFLINQSNKLII